MSIQAIREDMLSLRGAEVRVFGQPQTISEEVAEDTIDILDVLNELEGNEVKELADVYWNDEKEDYEETRFDSVEEYVDYMEDCGHWKEITMSNTYNWSAPLAHNIAYTVFKDLNTDDFYVKFMVHRYGDVRANYTEYALLQYTYEEGFLYDLMEANKTVYVGDYSVNIDILSDGMEVYNFEGEYVKTIYDLDDFRKEVENGEVSE